MVDYTEIFTFSIHNILTYMTHFQYTGNFTLTSHTHVTHSTHHHHHLQLLLVKNKNKNRIFYYAVKCVIRGGGEQNKLNNVHDKYMANKMNKLLNISDISLL